MKCCSKCEQEKESTDFNKRGRSNDGLRSWCKDCEKQYRINNKKKLQQYYKQYNSNRKEKQKRYSKQYRQRSEVKRRIKQYRIDNEKKIKQRDKQYYQDHKEEIKQYRIDNKEKMKQWYIDNRERVLTRTNKYNLNHKEEIKQYMKQYHQSDKGKRKSKRNFAKRYRNLKFIPLIINPFPKEVSIDYHHITNWFVIPLPTVTHKSFYGNNHRERGNIVINNLYTIDVGELFFDNEYIFDIKTMQLGE